MIHGPPRRGVISSEANWNGSIRRDRVRVFDRLAGARGDEALDTSHGLLQADQGRPRLRKVSRRRRQGDEGEGVACEDDREGRLHDDEAQHEEEHGASELIARAAVQTRTAEGLSARSAVCFSGTGRRAQASKYSANSCGCGRRRMALTSFAILY